LEEALLPKEAVGFPTPIRNWLVQHFHLRKHVVLRFQDC
jgi:hypothetical protein